MRQKHLKLEEKKGKILSYIEKYPLSSVREIADNYRGHKSRSDDAKTIVQQLNDKNKIQRIFKAREFYFVTPSRGKEKATLIQVMNSDKIFQQRFKKIPFRKKLYYDKPLFTQVVEQCINLMHIRSKILSIEIGRLTRGVHRTNELDPKELAKKEILEFLKTYSYKKDATTGPFKIKRKGFMKKTENPSQEKILSLLFDYISVECRRDQRYFDDLKTGRTSLKETIKLVKDSTESVSRSAHERGITNKAVRKKINRHIEPRYFESGEFLVDLLKRRDAENGRLLAKETSDKELNEGQSALFWNNMAKKVIRMRKPRLPDPDLSENNLELWGDKHIS